jgi:hypothetical protein
MNEEQGTAQAPATPMVPDTQAAAPAPRPAAPKLNAIQILEQELVSFFKQREQAVANLNAVEGAIQAAQHLLARLRAEAAKAETFVAAEAARAVEIVRDAVNTVEAGAKKVL